MNNIDSYITYDQRYVRFFVGNTSVIKILQLEEEVYQTRSPSYAVKNQWQYAPTIGICKRKEKTEEERES